jgi:hypothetical protein
MEVSFSFAKGISSYVRLESATVPAAGGVSRGHSHLRSREPL